MLHSPLSNRTQVHILSNIVVALCLAAAPAAARTFVIPHVLEKSGTIVNTQNTFDTQFFITYTGGLASPTPGSGATVDLYLFDQSTGGVLKSGT